MPDPSNGYDAIADDVIAARGDIGAQLVRQWASEALEPGASILDLGCGSGWPIAQVLSDLGFEISGIDASARLLVAFEERFPEARSACEPIETSAFFNTSFDAIIAIGVLFLLPEDMQIRVISKIAQALKPGGHVLFSAPKQVCKWDDVLTQNQSRSLGEAAYLSAMKDAGMQPLTQLEDSGGNNYFAARKF